METSVVRSQPKLGIQRHSIDEFRPSELDPWAHPPTERRVKEFRARSKTPARAGFSRAAARIRLQRLESKKSFISPGHPNWPKGKLLAY